MIFLNIMEIYKIISSTRTSVYTTIDILIYNLGIRRELMRVDILIYSNCLQKHSEAIRVKRVPPIISESS